MNVALADSDPGDWDYLGGEDPDSADYFDGPVLTATRWRNNAHMVASLAAGGLYLSDTDRVLDVTANSKKWWTEWRPGQLTTNDLDPRFDTDYHEDGRNLPFPNGTRASGYDVVCCDYPYISPGGRRTSTIGGFNDNYGLVTVPRNPAETLDLLRDGLTEAVRVARARNVGRAATKAGIWHAGGILLFKCTNYISSQTLQPVVYEIITHARTIPGLRFEDWFLHLGRPMAQPKERGKPDEDGNRKPHVQQHGRSNCSHLLVFRRVA